MQEELLCWIYVDNWDGDWKVLLPINHFVIKIMCPSVHLSTVFKVGYALSFHILLEKFNWGTCFLSYVWVLWKLWLWLCQAKIKSVGKLNGRCITTGTWTRMVVNVLTYIVLTGKQEQCCVLKIHICFKF